MTVTIEEVVGPEDGTAVTVYVVVMAGVAITVCKVVLFSPVKF